MFGGRRREAEVSERLQALEIRLASLAAEVQSEVRRLADEVARGSRAVALWEEKEVARVAALREATDKYTRTAERARKLGAVGAAGDSDADDEAYFRLANARRAAVGLPDED